MEGLTKSKKLILILVDIVLINFAYLASLYFRFTYAIPDHYKEAYGQSLIAITLIYVICFYLFKLYDSLWTYASIDEFLLAVGGCIMGTVLALGYGTIIGPLLPHSVTLLAGILSVLLVIGFRMSFRVYRRGLLLLGRADKSSYQRVMIIGAGSAGAMILKEMKNNRAMKYYPVALIDDSKYKQGTSIAGVKVLGNRQMIKAIAAEKHIDIILLAIPTLDNENKKQIIDICKTTNCALKMIPSMTELIDGKVTLNKIRDVDVEDLLGREPVKLDMEDISEYLQNKVVMVTGAGGSIGSELCRQIVRFNPRQLLLLEIYENSAYDLQNELKDKYPELDMKVLIASVRDRKRLEKIFKEFNIDVIFHAAAHKHVPLMEENPSEAIKNNAFGTLNIAELADKYAVKRFVMISTDKAVNPTNIMGASKRICEMIIQSMDKISKTQFVAVRFGNVLGSNGSVIPLFKKQIAKGGPVTLTHKEITRFFMTIPEACQLVLQAGAYAKGGEIFVLDMGKPMKIYDLAKDLIRLSGLEPGKDIEIKITGLRPGEKLYEELLMSEEGLEGTRHEKIFVGRPTYSDIEVLKSKLEEMRFVLENRPREELIAKVEELVPTYKREKKVVELPITKHSKVQETVAATVTAN